MYEQIEIPDLVVNVVIWGRNNSIRRAVLIGPITTGKVHFQSEIDPALCTNEK